MLRHWLGALEFDFIEKCLEVLLVTVLLDDVDLVVDNLEFLEHGDVWVLKLLEVLHFSHSFLEYSLGIFVVRVNCDSLENIVLAV